MFDALDSLKENISKDKRYIWAILSAIACGLVAHGRVVVDGLYYFDGFSKRTSNGAVSGRWFGDVYDAFDWLAIGMWGFLSTPLFNGILAFIFLGLASCVLITAFKIQNRFIVFLISGIMTTFPVITSSFGYTFQIHTFCLGIFLACLGSYLISKYEIKSALIGCFLISCSIGIYQAAIPIVLTVLLGILIEQCLEKDISWKEYGKKCVYYAVNCSVFMLMYALCQKVVLTLRKAELLDYQGISGAGKDGITAYIKRVPLAYKNFFIYDPNAGTSVYPLLLSKLYYLFLVLDIAIIVYILFFKEKRSFQQLIKVMIMLMALPLAVNFIYVMCGPQTYIYVLMVYSHITPLVALCILSEKAGFPGTNIGKIGNMGVSALLLVSLLILIKFDNMCYVKASFLQEQAKSYFTELITRMESTEGYSIDTPVIYINGNDKRHNDNHLNEFSKYTYDGFDKIKIAPYGMDSLVNDYSWESFMIHWCGFDPKHIDESQRERYESNNEVINMPRYPEAGSIKIVDGALVVKF